MTPAEMGSKGGKRAWADLSKEERSEVMRKRARKAWKTKRSKKNKPK
jgi:predicted Fe-S protein YdhL (DUF1289 family)